MSLIGELKNMFRKNDKNETNNWNQEQETLEIDVYLSSGENFAVEVDDLKNTKEDFHKFLDSLQLRTNASGFIVFNDLGIKFEKIELIEATNLS